MNSINKNIEVNILGTGTYNFEFYSSGKKVCFKDDFQKELAIKALTDTTGDPILRSLKYELNKHLAQYKNISSNLYEKKYLEKMFFSVEDNILSNAITNEIRNLYLKLEYDKRLLPLLIYSYYLKNIKYPATQECIQNIMAKIFNKKSCNIQFKESNFDEIDEKKVCKVLGISYKKFNTLSKKARDDQRSSKSENEAISRIIIEKVNNTLSKRKSKEIMKLCPILELNPCAKKGPYRGRKRTDICLTYRNSTGFDKKHIEILGLKWNEYVKNAEEKMIQSGLDNGYGCYFIITNNECAKKFKMNYDNEKYSKLEKDVIEWNKQNTLITSSKLDFIDKFYFQLTRMMADSNLSQFLPEIEDIF